MPYKKIYLSFLEHLECKSLHICTQKKSFGQSYYGTWNTHFTVTKYFLQVCYFQIQVTEGMGETREICFAAGTLPELR
jgi:hypothetical protein